MKILIQSKKIIRLANIEDRADVPKELKAVISAI